MQPKISMIAAIGNGPLHKRVLGKGNQLLWHIPEDLKRFKLITGGHPVVMGRKTFESIVASLGKPLPGRTNIVVTRDKEWSYEGVRAVYSIEEALELARNMPGSGEIFIIGGGEIYAQGLRYADKLYLTLIDDDKEGDVYFPEYEHVFKKRVHIDVGEHNGLSFTWIDLERS